MWVLLLLISSVTHQQEKTRTCQRKKGNKQPSATKTRGIALAFLHVSPSGSVGDALLLSLGLSIRHLSIGLLDLIAVLRQDQLDVGRRGHEGIDSAVGTVGSATELGGTVHLDVRNVQRVDIETLNLGIALGVLEEIKEESARLLGPSALTTTDVVLLSLSSAAGVTLVSSEGHGILVLDDVVQEPLSLLERKPLDGLGRLTSVLEVNTEV